MGCNICGSANHYASTAGCPDQRNYTPVGWECPVCHMGNGPGVEKCRHCADRADAEMSNSWNDPFWNGFAS